MNQFIALFLALCAATTGMCQNLGAFSDKMGYFYVFDNGNKIKLEQIQVEDFEVGGNAVGYIDNMSNFNIYYDGESTEIADFAYTTIEGSQELLAFNMGSLLYVFDHGETVKLSNWATAWQFVGEEIVYFWDEFQHEARIYYEGEIHSVSNDLGTVVFNPIDLGDCVLGFYNTQNYFTGVFGGSTYDLRRQIDVMETKSSRNLIAITSTLSPALSIFHSGNYYELESAFPPKSFEVGIDMCAYVDYSGEFKLYYNYDLTTISSFQPTFYEIKDSILVFSEQGYFKAVYDGQTYELENYVPENYVIDNGSIAYLDQQNRLKLFRRGELIEVSNQIVNGFSLTGNVLIYGVGLRNYEIFFHDLTFE